MTTRKPGWVWTLFGAAALVACSSTPLPEQTSHDETPRLAHTNVDAQPPLASLDRSAEPSESSCEAVEAPDHFHQAVEGAHRGCAADDECRSVILSCSNLDCTGVHRRHENAYRQTLDCDGYEGIVGNYDCRPRFGSEHAVCRKGCCVSERLVPLP